MAEKDRAIIVYPDDRADCFFVDDSKSSVLASLSPEKILGFACLTSLNSYEFLSAVKLSELIDYLNKLSTEILEGVSLVLCGFSSSDLPDSPLVNGLNVVVINGGGNQKCDRYYE